MIHAGHFVKFNWKSVNWIAHLHGNILGDGVYDPHGGQTLVGALEFLVLELKRREGRGGYRGIVKVYVKREVEIKREIEDLHRYM